MPISGATGFLGEAGLTGINAYVGMVNSQGGVKGRKIKTVVYDTQFDPAVEATGTRQLVDQAKVFGLFGIVGDSSADFVTSKGIPFLDYGFTPPAYSSKNPTIYPFLFSDLQSIALHAYYWKKIKKAPIKKVSILYDTQNINIKSMVPWMAKAWTSLGVNIASLDEFNLSDVNCDRIVTKVKGENIDFWSSGYTLGWPICLASAGRQGYRPPYGLGGPYTADAKYLDGAGQAVDGVYGLTNGVLIEEHKGEPYPWDPSGKAPEVDNFINSVKKYAPNGADMYTLEGIWAQTSWVTAKLLVEAIAHQTQAITWKGVNQYIQGLSNWKSGLISPIKSFKPTCKTGPDMWVFQWFRRKDGTMAMSDWRPYGGPIKLPVSYENSIVPGGGDCYLTKMADTVVK